jgi:RNA polymerase sigma-70 factor (ECF subfamily)
MTPDWRRIVHRLVETYYGPLYRYAYRLSGSAADAEDLTQETFCKAQQFLAQLREPGRAKPWLFSILRNLYLHRVRAAKHQPTVPLAQLDELIDPSSQDLPEIDSESLQQALNDLPEVYRTPIILYYFEDFSYRDIADQMDLPIGTVMSRLARAKSFLRERLLPRPEEAVTGPPTGRTTDGL